MNNGFIIEIRFYGIMVVGGRGYVSFYIFLFDVDLKLYNSYVSNWGEKLSRWELGEIRILKDIWMFEDKVYLSFLD